ncbi:MAG: cation-translocating P-type ATPase [Chloroflexi bacterium]|nr:cation-translocating P-type ATPase [Chloroflexota bacterium]
MSSLTKFELPVKGMDCADCALHVEHAIAAVPGVSRVQVYLATEKAVIETTAGAEPSLAAIQKAVASAGYEIVDPAAGQPPTRQQTLQAATQRLTWLVALVFGSVLFVLVVGEWLGLFEKITRQIPWYAALPIILIAGFPVFKNVLRSALQGKVISHTLMTLGVIAAIAVGEWVTAAVVVFFMRVGDLTEHFTTDRARQSLRRLHDLAPQTARLWKEEGELEVAIENVHPGDIVVVRPGEKIPVDGRVVAGSATVNQAAITGEAMPLELEAGSRVYAASVILSGSLRVEAAAVRQDSTFGKVIRLVEEAEGNKAQVQRTADRFAGYYLPVVAAIALLTFLLRRDPLATAAVLVVACSCSFALATPIAMLASIGSAARGGLLVKGGRYLELLDRVDTLLVDKTGTLTFGQPQISDVIALRGTSDELLRLAASAERYSEHPLAQAVLQEALRRGIPLAELRDFSAHAGVGVTALVEDRPIRVGGPRLLAGDPPQAALELASQGKSLLYVFEGERLLGLMAAADTLRPEISAALKRVRALGIRQIELLTGDHAASAQHLAGQLGIPFRAGLLPEEKIEIVREYQRQGRVVMVVGDGVNDAPALAQADVGVAMGLGGSDVAIETAPLVLMREDWELVPQALLTARRTMRVIRGNIAFTTLYNLIGLSLAAFGILPPVLAAAAQSLPDLGILANSARLIRQNNRESAPPA